MEQHNKDRLYAWWDDRAKISAEVCQKSTFNDSLFVTPKQIYEYFDSKIYGCEDYKKKLSVAVWSALHRQQRTNMMVIGESGCGKTSLAICLKEIYPGQTKIFDASNVSPKSFKGNTTLTDCLIGIDDTSPSFIFIDEFDKALSKSFELGNMLESELLKLTEGCLVYAGEDKNRTLVDTSLVNFIFMGTFASLKAGRSKHIGFNFSNQELCVDSAISRDEIINSGMISNEFLGRLNGGIIQLHSMTVETAKAILSDPRYSPVNKLAKEYGISINLSANKFEELATSTSKYGVRGIYGLLQEELTNALFEDSEIKSINM